MSLYRLEELSTRALDRLPREQTIVILPVSPLEEHGPHLPLGVDAFTAEHFARALAARIVIERAGWCVVLAPLLHLGSFTFDHVGTVYRFPVFRTNFPLLLSLLLGAAAVVALWLLR
ncbi:MAG: creatininase family protein [Candidatus Rokubacteria bacterium]|nr:creatininase family protein [Candidatus Rokubacteria bacterium]